MENQEYKKYSEEQLLEIITVINEKAEKDNSWLIAMWKGLSHDAKMQVQKLMKEYHFKRNIGTIGHIDHGITTIIKSRSYLQDKKIHFIEEGKIQDDKMKKLLEKPNLGMKTIIIDSLSSYNKNEEEYINKKVSFSNGGTNKLPKKKKRKK
jgi:hypothetical protein